MAERERAMGRGLAAILSVAPREEPEELRQIPTELIGPSPHQPRTTFDEAGLLALAESIKVRGVLQPVLVRPIPGGTYELVAGERRWRAAQLAELDVLPAIVRYHDDAASLEVALIENMVREDLNPVDEARACAALTEELGLTREEVGARVGRSRVAVSNLIRLLDLPDEVLAAIERRGPQRGARARAAARGGSRRPPPAGPRCGRRRLVGPGARGARAPREHGRRQPTPPAQARPPAAPRPGSGDPPHR